MWGLMDVYVYVCMCIINMTHEVWCQRCQTETKLPHTASHYNTLQHTATLFEAPETMILHQRALISCFFSLRALFEWSSFGNRETHMGTLWSKETPPPRGSFLFTMFPDQEPGGRGPPLKNHPENWSILWVVLQGGSSSSGFLIREHSR